MGHDLTIYNRRGEKKFNLFSRANVSTVTRASQKTTLLADDTITISATSARPLNLTIGDYLIVFGKRYKFNQLPQPTKAGERVYSYEMTLEGLQYDLIDAHYHLPADAYGETYYANLPRHLEILAWNINRIHSGWTVQVDPDAYDPDDYQNITATQKNCLAMLQDLCSMFKVEFEITAAGSGGVVRVRKKAGITHPFTLRYGRGRGLYQLARTNVNNAGITNRLYVYGSQENLPKNYGHNRLCLAETSRLTSYIEDAASIEAYGVKEDEKTYPHIKAERIGVITALGEDRLTFFDTSGSTNDPQNPPMFDLNEKDSEGNTLWLIPDTSAKITFQTGNLAGYEFDLQSYDHATKKFKINRFTDENGLAIPNDQQDAFSFGVGDKYIITDIQLPDAYVKKAQAKLAAAARADFPPMTQPQVSYKLGLAEDFFKANFVTQTETEVLHVGDYVHIIDNEIGVDKEVRITSITRDLLRPHSYEITLSDTVTKSSIVKVLNDISDIQDAISYNTGFTDPGKARRRWLATQELLNMVFDPEGDYYSEKIKPLSIETQMLSVGAKSTQFTLNNVTIQPNYNGTPAAINFSSGLLVHYGINPDAPRTWAMAGATYGALKATSAYYIYARCPRETGNGTFILSTNPVPCEAHASFYYFLVGVLNSVSTDQHGGNAARLISLTYGSSTINGRFVRCGRIESSGGGATYFDLDTGVISGKILFRSSDGTVTDVADLEDKTNNLEDYVNNVLPGTFDGISSQIDGKIETWFQEADPAENWSTDELLAHVGDLWFNTSTKELKRFSEDYQWERIEDADAIAAAEAASRAQDTADGKRRIFVTTPTTPYDVGDMWAQGSTGDLMRCIKSRATGAFQSSDWDKASKYTGDENLNDFIENTYNVAMAEIAHQLDGVIETHFGTGVPTLTNAPANGWTTPQDKEAHLGDLYYDNDTGIAYRFSKEGNTYKWVEVRDSGVTAALEAASKAQDTADGKRRVFTAQPYTPYDQGDLWASGTFLKVCIKTRASGSYQAGDWDLATNYTSDENLNEFINGVFDETVSDIYEQLDGKLESFYGTTDPATDWKTDEERAKHVGDQWYNTSTKELKRYTKSKTTPVTYSWVKIENADAIAAAEKASQAQDTADGKRRVFIAEPYPPYDPGDLWAQGETGGDIMVCITGRQTGNFKASDWTKASNYTDDSALTDFILGQYSDDLAGLLDQIDGKIECFYTSTNPANSWQVSEYAEHLGDQWYDTTNKKLYRWTSANWLYVEGTWTPVGILGAVGAAQDYANHKTYYWSRIQDADALAAAAAAAQAQDTADGKRTVFVEQPKGPYYVGDLWLKGIDSTGKAAGGLWRCIKDNTVAGAFAANDWVEATYYDCTQTVIDGGIVTAGTVQLANQFTASIVAGITGGFGKTWKETATTPESQKVRIWAGASEGNRRSAPFRVLQNGKVIASDADIAGKITSKEGEIGGWKLAAGTLKSSDKDDAGNDITPAITLDAEAGEIRAADSVVMDADGFGLLHNNYAMVRIANVSVGQYNDHILRQSYDRLTNPETVTQVESSGYIPHSGAYTWNPYKTVTIPLGFFERGSVIQLGQFQIYFTVPGHKNSTSVTISASIGSIRVLLKRNGETLRAWSSRGASGFNGNIVTAQVSCNATHTVAAGEQGDYSIVIESLATWTWTATSTGELNSFTIYTSAKYKYTRGNYQRTLLGYDGLVSTWGSGSLFLNEEGFIVKFGNYALRVTPSGLQKSSNGGSTWTSL